jgi:hypothetical protein
MNELSPFLDKNKKEKEGFTVPKHYFSNLQLEIMQQVQAELPVAQPMRAVRSLSWWQWLQVNVAPRYALALASVLVVVGAYFFYPTSTKMPDVAASPVLTPSTKNLTENPPSTKEEEMEVLPVIEHSAKTQVAYQNIITEEAETYINQNIEEFDTDNVIAANTDALESVAFAENISFDEKSIQQYLEENIEDIEEEDLK